MSMEIGFAVGLIVGLVSVPICIAPAFWHNGWMRGWEEARQTFGPKRGDDMPENSSEIQPRRSSDDD